MNMLIELENSLLLKMLKLLLFVLKLEAEISELESTKKKKNS